MAKSKLVAAALLKDDLADDDKIHGTLFAVAFGELDELREKIAKIPSDIDVSANRFQKITTQAVDDFVTVANEALSKFMQRTNEIKGALDAIEGAEKVAVATPVLPASPAPVVAAVEAPLQGKASQALWWIIPVSVCVGIAIGAVVSVFVMF